MAGRIRQDDVEAVRQHADIAKVISGFIQLKKAGQDRLVGLCPFHPEKTPSFSVSPSKQVYYCFGCGEGGNVFRFLEKAENLSFVEAVERLARDAGISLRYEGQSTTDRRASGRRQLLHRAIEEAVGLYHRMLLEGREAEEARGYLASRGISEASVERFGIGYAPGYSDFLLRRLAKSYSPELLAEAGLVADIGSGQRDRFRGRVVFPLHDLSGNAVGFGGRLLAGPNAPTNAPKYLNPPETPVYRKGKLLYNLHRAKTDIGRSGRAYVVEGYTDVVALDQAGIPEAVATCGTALGEEHIRLLSRFTQRVVLAFDSDEAGAKAAELAYAFHQQYDVAVSVLVLPQGQDPADFVLARGEAAGDAFRALSESAVSLVEYMIDRTLRGRNLTDVEERAGAVRDGLGIVAGLEEPVRRQEYARILADRVGVGVESVLLELESVSRGSNRKGATGPRPDTRMPPNQRVEREDMKLLIQNPELCPGTLNDLDRAAFATPAYQKAFDLLTDARDVAPAELVARAHERGESLGRLVASLAVESTEAGGDPGPHYAQRVFLRLEEFALSRQIDALRKEIERVNPLKAPEDYNTMFERLVALEGARRRARSAADAVTSGV
jgi:DNA primase